MVPDGRQERDPVAEWRDEMERESAVSRSISSLHSARPEGLIAEFPIQNTPEDKTRAKDSAYNL